MPVVTLLSGATANGPGTALDCRNAKKASFVITGTFKAAVSFEFSQDGTNYYPFTGKVNGGLDSSVTYSPGHVLFDVEPVGWIRPNISQYESGSITVTGYVDDKEAAVFNYAHFDAATAGTLVKSGPGVLHSVSIGDAGSAMVVRLHDGTSTAGPLIGVYKVAGTWVLDVKFNTGLYVTISATTMGDVTIAYE